MHGDDHDRGVASPANGHDDEQQLLALLRALVRREGPVKAAEALGVTYRTVTRAIETNTLTGRMEDALKRRQLEAGGSVAERLDVLDRRQDRLEAGLTALGQEAETRLGALSGELRAVRDGLPGARLGGEVETGCEAMGDRGSDGTPAVKGAPLIGQRKHLVKRRPWPDVVTLEPEDSEELVYRDVTPLVVEWREARRRLLEAERHIDRLDAEERLYTLEVALISEHGLTLPPFTDAWPDFVRDDELRLREEVLGDVRADRRRALALRWLRRLLTLGLWWN